MFNTCKTRKVLDFEYFVLQEMATSRFFTQVLCSHSVHIGEHTTYIFVVSLGTERFCVEILKIHHTSTTLLCFTIGTTHVHASLNDKKTLILRQSRLETLNLSSAVFIGVQTFHDAQRKLASMPG